MSLDGHIVMLESGDGSTEALVGRIEQLGVEPIVAQSLDEVRQVIFERQKIISALLIPTDLGAECTPRDVKRLLKELKKTGAGLVLVSTGKPPTRDERKKLRSLGLQLALWEPFDDGTLRFQINRAVSGDTNEHGRRQLRVPTYLFARVHVGDRSKDAIIYSLSEGGAFLETPRASMNGATIDVEIRLPSQPLMVKAEVVFSNVTGNLQRPNLPMGMGVRFEGVSKQESKLLSTYISERAEQLEV